MLIIIYHQIENLLSQAKLRFSANAHHFLHLPKYTQMTYLKPSAPKIVAASPALMLPPSPPHCG